MTQFMQICSEYKFTTLYVLSGLLAVVLAIMLKSYGYQPYLSGLLICVLSLAGGLLLILYLPSDEKESFLIAEDRDDMTVVIFCFLLLFCRFIVWAGAVLFSLLLFHALNSPFIWSHFVIAAITGLGVVLSMWTLSQKKDD